MVILSPTSLYSYTPGKIEACAKGCNELQVPPGPAFYIPVSSSAAVGGGVPPGPAFYIPVSSSVAAGGGVPPSSAFHIPVSTDTAASGSVLPGSQLCFPLPIGTVPPGLPFRTCDMNVIPSAPSRSGSNPSELVRPAVVENGEYTY